MTWRQYSLLYRVVAVPCTDVACHSVRSSPELRSLHRVRTKALSHPSTDVEDLVFNVDGPHATHDLYIAIAEQVGHVNGL